MKIANTRNDAAEVLNRNSVQFDSDSRYNDQQAWPFWYPFIPYPYLDTDSLNGNLGLMGFRVPAGRIVDIPINLARDAVFRLINSKYVVYRPGFGSRLTGTISTTAGSTTLTGVGTLFTAVAPAIPETIVGQTLIWIDDAGAVRFGTIARIDSATSLELENPAVSAATGVNFYLIAWKNYDTVQNWQLGGLTVLTGTITFTAATGALAGAGTAFVAELEVGDTIVANDALGIRHNIVITAIAGAAAATGTGTTNIPAGSAAARSEHMTKAAGSITIAAGTNVIAGVGTLFGVELVAGDVVSVIDSTGAIHYLQIAAVAAADGAACATVTEVLGAAISVPALSHMTIMARAITGTATLTAANRLAVDAAASVFLTDVASGDVLWYVDAAGVVAPERAVVEHVDSDARLKFYNPVTTDSGVGVILAVGLNNAGTSPISTALNFVAPFYPLSDFVRVTLSFPSLGARYSYGGNQKFDNQGLNERPRLISELQGSDQGFGGRLRTPALLPYEGLVNIRVTNDYSEDIIINGHLFGYKIAIVE